MEPSAVCRLFKERYYEEIGNKMTGEFVFKVQMYEGGARLCRSMVDQELKEKPAKKK